MSVLTCPVCQGAMREVNREGILIDVCTQCRGVWLDRGELEKLAGLMSAAPAEPMRAAHPPYPEDRPRGDAYGHREPGRDWGGDRHYGGERGEYGERGDYGERGEYGERGYRKKSGVSRFLDFFD